MPPTRRRPKPPKRGGTAHVAPRSTSQLLSPLEAFFANYAPRFQYNARASASLEFYRLCKESGWDREDHDRKTAHQDFKDALVEQFNVFYGIDVNDIGAWQNLCHVVRIDPVPEGLHACREAVYYTFVNLVDLVDTKTTGVEVTKFDSELALSAYTKSTGKFFPSDEAKAGGVLRYLLRQILHPRDGYNVSRRGGKRGGSRRR